MKIPYNVVICEVLTQHKNFLETGNMQISKQDLVDRNKTNQIKKLTNNQKKICDIIIDIQACFS